jgi:hypothetical protein
MHIVIIGGGASGFMAAITAAEQNPAAEILLLEKSKSVLNKVRISGGGRCNVTNACFDNRALAKNYPRGEKFLKRLLPQFSTKDTITWFEERGVQLKTEVDGRMFPSTNSSETIIDCLLRQTKINNVTIRTSCGVKSFSYSDEQPHSHFFLHLLTDEVIETDRLLIATGGYPQLKGFDWIAQNQHDIITPVPSLFTFNVPGSYLLPLSGVSVADVVAKISGTTFEWRGPILLTHWGFSGPAILKLSAWGARVLSENNYKCLLRINWVPTQEEDEIRTFLIKEKELTPKQLLTSHARFGIPIRLWKAFLQQAEILETMRWADVPHKPLNRLVNLLVNSQFEVDGKSTFKEEFVTAGGISLSEINQSTLESKKVKGLFFSGEVLDVDGITGGFNFQNAWTTGYIAGKMLSKIENSPKS